MPGVRIGTWYSASWRSCSPTGGPANSLGIVFPGGLRRHSHRTRRAYRRTPPGSAVDKGSKPNCVYFLRKILDYVENRLHKIFCRALICSLFRKIKLENLYQIRHNSGGRIYIKYHHIVHIDIPFCKQRVNPKFCVNSISGANRAKFICGGSRLVRLPPW